MIYYITCDMEGIMQNTKTIVLAGFLACLAALFQLLPLFLSEAFVILTIFSSIPIYIICRINPRLGITAAITSFILISLLSPHEALFFICTNGPVGASLGCFSHYVRNKQIIIFVSSIILSCTLCIMNFIIGIPILGTPLSGTFIIQVFIIIIFSYIYTYVYWYFSQFIFKRLKGFII